MPECSNNEKSILEFRSLLKGFCHDDFVVLGQFCAKIVSVFIYTQNVPDKL